MLSMIRFTGLFAVAFGAMLTLTSIAEAKSGSFRGQGRYSVSGTATVVKSGGGWVVRLSGFRTTSGPDLRVYVGKGGPSRSLGRLRSTRGTQTYRLPKGWTPASLSSVHIYCKRFSSTFGTARLR